MDTEHESLDRDLARLYSEYVDRLIAGETLDLAAIEDAHPQVAAELIERLADFEELLEPSAPATLTTLGDYTLRRMLGRGGMGVVYEAWQGSMDRVVALKVLPAGVAADPRAFHRFLREAKTAGQLMHQNVVSVYSTGVEEGTPWYSMEYVEGSTLAQLLRMPGSEAEKETDPFTKPSGLADFAHLAKAFADVADGLQHAHARGVIHRDLKPSNLILDADGRLRILDFGLARLEGEQSLTLSGDFLGTPAYMSPEQARRKKDPVDHRTDIYSLGATLYELITGELPFRGKDHGDTLSQIIERDPPPPHQTNPRVPAALETIVLKCLRKDPAARYATAEALAQDLRRFERGDPVEARPEAALEKLARRAKRHRGKLIVAAGALTAFVICGVLTYRLVLGAQKTAAVEYEKAVPAAQWKLLRGQTVLASRQSQRVTASILRLQQGSSPLRGAAQQSVEEAVAGFEAATALVPEPFEAHYYRARGLQLLGRFDKALEAVEQCLLLRPSFTPAQWVRVELQKRKGTTSAQAPELPTSVPWGSTWKHAQSALEERDWQLAVEAYNALLETERHDGELFLGSSIELLLGRGTAHLKLKNYTKAQADFSTAHYLWNDALEPALLLGKAYHLEGKVGEAEEVFEELVAGYPEKDAARHAIAATYNSLDAYDEALTWFRRLEAPPNESSFQVKLGTTLLKALWKRGLFQKPLSERSQSRELFELAQIAKRALALDSQKAGAHTLWGGVLEAQGKFQEAEESFAQARALSEAKRQQRRSRDMRLRARDLVLPAMVIAGAAGAQEGQWSGPMAPLGVNSPFIDWSPSLTADGLELYFTSERPAPVELSGLDNVWVATRTDPGEPFGTPTFVEELSSPADEPTVNVASDGLTVYFTSERVGGWGGRDIYKATRAARGGKWDDITNGGELEEINSEADEDDLTISGDGLVVVFARGHPSDQGDLYIATRADTDKPFGGVRRIEGLSTQTYSEINPSLSSDGLALFFGEFSGVSRPGGYGGNDLWVVTRENRDQSFGEARNVGSRVNGDRHDWSPFVWGNWPHEEATLYFTRWEGDGRGSEIYQSTWTPIAPADRWFIRADVNSDRVIDLTDAVSIVNALFLGRGEVTCDKAADANDDGAVDIADPTFILNALFLGGEGIGRPGICGKDPTPDGLVCEEYPRCSVN